MKTAILLIVTCDDPQFYVVDGDFSHLNNAAIEVGGICEKGEALASLLWSTDGNMIQEPVSFEEFISSIREGALGIMAVLVS